MNKEEFKQFMYYEFPYVFENSFTREMLSNILAYAENMDDPTERYNFLSGIIPEVTEEELKEIHL